MHPSQPRTGPTTGCPTRPGLGALLDPLLLDPRPSGLLLVGVLLRRNRLRTVVRPLEASDTHVPRCWRAAGLVTDVTTRRSDDDRPRPGRLLHLVDRHGSSLTRLATDGHPPRTANEGRGRLDDLCRRLLGISPSAGRGQP